MRKDARVLTATGSLRTHRTKAPCSGCDAISAAVATFLRTQDGHWVGTTNEFLTNIAALVTEDAEGLSNTVQAIKSMLSQCNRPITKHRYNGLRQITVSEPTLTCRDLAERTGLPEHYFQRMARSGRLPAYRGTHGPRTPFRFKEEEFQAWWANHMSEYRKWQKTSTSTSAARFGGRAKDTKGRLLLQLRNK